MHVKYGKTIQYRKPRFYLIEYIKAKKPSWGEKAEMLGKKPSAGHTELDSIRSLDVGDDIKK